MQDLVPAEPQDLVTTGDQPLDRNPAAVYLAGLNAETGRRTMRQALDTMAAMLTNGKADAVRLDWSALRFQHVTAVRARLQESGARPATVNKYLCALRGALRAAWLLGQMTAEDYHRAAAVKGIKAETLPAGRELSRDELGGLLAACNEDESPAGARDAALIALLYGTGLRRAEVVSLDVEDYEPATGRLVVRGKGGKERIAWVAVGVGEALRRWLAVRGETTGALFWPIRKDGSPEPRRVTSQAVYNALQKRGQEAGVRPFSPHDLRRTFVSDLLDAGADIAVVSRMAGHASITTTARYDRRGEEAKRKAADLLKIPPVPRKKKPSP